MKNNVGIHSWIQSDYKDKGTDFSASDFSKPNYQLWVSKNFEKNKDDEQGFKACVGQLVHQASCDSFEVGVIKEVSFVSLVGKYTVGGSMDRLAWNKEYSGWQVEDIKTQGMYPAKASFKNNPDSWTSQLSIYAYMADDHGIKTLGQGVIHQYVMGFQKNKDGMEEYNKIDVDLYIDHKNTRDMMIKKMDMAKSKTPPDMDCKTYMCADYCSHSNSCPHYSTGSTDAFK